MEQPQTYAGAMARIEQIMKQIEDNPQDIDALTTNLKEAQALLRFCKEKLYAVDKQVGEILAEG